MFCDFFSYGKALAVKCRDCGCHKLVKCQTTMPGKGAGGVWRGVSRIDVPESGGVGGADAAGALGQSVHSGR